jgi:hypothetical protein
MKPALNGSLKWSTPAVIAAALIALAGCTGSLINSRSQSPEHADDHDSDSQTKLVGDYTDPYGMSYIRVEGPALVTGLSGTGSDPPPGPQRQALLADMEARGVVNSNKVLASTSSSLVWARAYLPPGAHKGDPIDIDIRVPPDCETTSLRGGWMLETRLKEMAVIAGQVHDGHVMATAEGPVMVDPSAHETADPSSHETAERAAKLRGRVLGSGVVLKSRMIGLVIHENEKSVFLSKQIGDALNKRFHTYVHSVKQGVATPKTDAFIELEIHPRYKYNLGRYLQVVRSVALFETPQSQIERLELLQRQLLDPVTCAQAAIRLEAVGKEGVAALKKGLESSDPEVKFHSAEALAYLDEASAVPVLAAAVKDEPAFRANALAALGALDDVQAADALREMFDLPSAETRYGAFRALWSMNPHDPQLRGEHLGDKFWLHTVPCAGSAMVHVTHSFRPEIVLFGEGQAFKLPLAVEAGNSIIVKSQPDGQISVARFAAHQPDQRRTVENSVAEVVRTIVALGGDYPDAVQALQEARIQGSLESRFEVDAIPEGGRAYDRPKAEDQLAAAKTPGSAAKKSATRSTDSEPHASQLDSTEPLPTLFGGGRPGYDDQIDSESSTEVNPAANPEQTSSEDSENSAAMSKGFRVK